MTLQDAVIYELHVGTFTPEGTLDAAIGRLDSATAKQTIDAAGMTASAPNSRRPPSPYERPGSQRPESP